MWVAAECDLSRVVGGEVRRLVGWSSPAGAPVAVPLAVRIDRCLTPRPVSGLGGLRPELSLPATVVAAVLRAA